MRPGKGRHRGRRVGDDGGGRDGKDDDDRDGKDDDRDGKDECLGILGLILGILGGIVGIVWLVAYQGSTASFVLLIASALVGWVSFMYCETWEGSSPFGE